MKVWLAGMAVAGMALGLACGGGEGTTDLGPRDIPVVHVDFGGGDGQAPWDPGPDATRCQNENDCSGDTPYCDPRVGVCVECRDLADCRGQGYCINGSCRNDLFCMPGSKSCTRNKARICNEQGTAMDEHECGDLVCWEGDCLACIPGSVDCPQINVARLCRLDGSGWEEKDCGSQRCVNGQCVECVPGFRICQGSSVMTCTLDGAGFAFTEDCDTENTGRLCHLGICMNLCEFNAKFKTNQGCEYWATDLDQYVDSEDQQYGGGANAPYAIVVSNINASFKATVRVTNASGYERTYEAPPKTATIINLPANNISGSGLTTNAWHLTSNLPVVAYQFNPLENAKVYSNDASLLFPTTALGKHYRVLSWPTIGRNSDGQLLASTITVVAVEEGETEVTVTVTAPVQSGPGVPAMARGASQTFRMQKGQVLNLEAASVPDDFTGSLVEASRKVAVFGGHVCANAPYSTCKGGRCSYDPLFSCTVDSDCPPIAACDHLEEQIQPISTWGKTYVVSRTMPRGKAPDVVRVLAAHDGTHITSSPQSIAIPTLNAGEWFEFEISDHIVLTGDQPFLVGQYLEGQNAPYSAHSGCYNSLSGELCEDSPGSCVCDSNFNSCTKQAQCSPDDANIGDPAFLVGVPIEQFRSEYVFLVPIKYRSNFVNIVAPVGAKVTLDGSVLSASQFQNLPGGQYMVSRLPMQPGSHTLSADKRVGITVYGWDFYVSYAYAGGMNIETLSPDL